MQTHTWDIELIKSVNALLCVTVSTGWSCTYTYIYMYAYTHIHTYMYATTYLGY